MMPIDFSPFWWCLTLEQVRIIQQANAIEEQAIIESEKWKKIPFLEVRAF